MSQVENTFLFCFTKASKACFRWGGVGWGPTCAGRLPHRPCQESPGRDHPQPRQGDEAGAGAGGRGAGRAGAWGPRQPRHRGLDPGRREARHLFRLHGGREQPDRGAGAHPEDGGGDLAQQICNEAAALCRDTGLRPHVLGKIKPDKKVTTLPLCSLLCMVEVE